MTLDRTRLHANEIKPRLKELRKKALSIEPNLATRINKIGTTVFKYKNELIDKKQFLIEFLNEFYYDIQTYLSLPKEKIQEFYQQKNISLTEYYWYSLVLSNWLTKEDPKFSYWIEKLLLEEYKGNDQNLILALTQKINTRTDGSASHRYILDLSMATDLLVSHVPSQLQPVFVQLTGIPTFRDGQLNPDFIKKQQRWDSTLSYWCIKRALLVAHNSEVNRPDNLLILTDAILKESSARPAEFRASIVFHK